VTNDKQLVQSGIEDGADLSVTDTMVISKYRNLLDKIAPSGLAIFYSDTPSGPYDENDYAIMVGNIYHRLCEMPEEWRDMRSLAYEVKGFDNMDDVAFITESILMKMEYIENNPDSNDVRLTSLAKRNCQKEIKIPSSDVQELKARLGV
jgi:hypothetical protein